MEPPSMVSRWSMQRSAVLLPEPEAPMIATTSPGLISSDMPRRTSLSPNLLRTSCSLTIADIEFPFHGPAPARERIAQAEVEEPNQRENQERLEQRVVDDLAGAGQLDK